MTRRPTLDAALLRLHAGLTTKADERLIAAEMERLRAFEQAIRGAAEFTRVYGQIQPVIERFDISYRDPNDATPATTREHQ